MDNKQNEIPIGEAEHQPLDSEASADLTPVTEIQHTIEDQTQVPQISVTEIPAEMSTQSEIKYDVSTTRPTIKKPKNSSRKTSKSSLPTYNSFFSIVFAGSPSGRSSTGGPSSVAVANSFNTGKQGSALSEATAFGGPQ